MVSVDEQNQQRGGRAARLDTAVRVEGVDKESAPASAAISVTTNPCNDESVQRRFRRAEAKRLRGTAQAAEWTAGVACAGVHARAG
jgi:hypothetical protein